MDRKLKPQPLPPPSSACWR